MKIKAVLICGLAVLFSLPFGGLSCAREAEDVAPAAPDTIEISCDEFGAQKNISREVGISHPGSQIVILCANPTTGFQWTESAQISDPTVIYQDEYNFVSPDEEDVVGASGKDVWTFKTLKPGTSTISLDYSRPWEGGEKGEWTFTLVVTVE